MYGISWVSLGWFFCNKVFNMMYLIESYRPHPYPYP